ncbi:MAG: hypothetical protein WAV47_08490 [Blastocatellia bacterium]
MSDTSVRYAVAVALLIITSHEVLAVQQGPPPAREATIQGETKARLTLQSQINSKLSEADDTITATLAEPIYVEGQMVLPRGAEFHGQIIRVAPAKRGPRRSNMSIVFDRVVTPSGEVPISAQVTAIDDWDREETIKADREGKLKGGGQGGKTLQNMHLGSQLGFSAAIIGVTLGGAAGASGGQALGIGGVGLAAGMLGGLLLTKGSEIRASPGTILRIIFTKPATVPVTTQSSASLRSNQ